MKIKAKNKKGDEIILMVTNPFLPVIDENGFDFIEVELYRDNIERTDCVWFDKNRNKGYKPSINKKIGAQNRLIINKKIFNMANDLFEYIKLAKL